MQVQCRAVLPEKKSSLWLLLLDTFSWVYSENCEQKVEWEDLESLARKGAGSEMRVRRSWWINGWTAF